MYESRFTDSAQMVSEVVENLLGALDQSIALGILTEQQVLDAVNEARGKQPDEAIQSLPGALSGDTPLSIPDMERK